MSAITVIGNAVTDPELIFTPCGKAVARDGSRRTRGAEGESWVDGATSYHAVQF